MPVTVPQDDPLVLEAAEAIQAAIFRQNRGLGSEPIEAKLETNPCGVR